MIVRFRDTLINTKEIAFVDINQDTEAGDSFDCRDKDIFVLRVRLKDGFCSNFLFYQQEEAEKAFDELAELTRCA